MLTIGIAGGTGSGKTTLAETLAEEYAPYVTVLKHDNYYKAHNDMTYEERCHINYDEPAAFDNDLFIEHLAELKAGRAINCPIYDYTQHNRSKETVVVEPNHVLVVEGILIFTDPRVCRLFDAKIFVDTDDDIRLIRRIRRDVTERARTLESVLTQYETTVKPMHDLYVKPSEKAADIVVLDGGRNVVARELITSRIEKELRLAGKYNL